MSNPMQPMLVAPGELRSAHLPLLRISGREYRVLLSAPGLVAPALIDDEIAKSPWRAMPLGKADRHQDAILVHFRADIDRLPQTAEWESWVADWLAQIETGKLQFRFWERAPLFSRLLSGDTTIALAGPLHEQLDRADHELRIELHGSEHERAREWFTQRFDEARDITASVEDCLRNSWAGSLIAPQDAYYKALSSYFSSILSSLDEELDSNPLVEQLTEFQRDAYQYAKSMLHRYGGVFLADVVGLGKTFIALALISYLQRRQPAEHAVVVGPPKLQATWEGLARELKVEIVFVSSGKLSDLDAYSDRGVLVLDESHNFRNTGTSRYRQLTEWLRPNGLPSDKKVILLSATPQNNDIDDIKNQLGLFPDTYMRLPFQGESLEDWFALVRTRTARSQLTDMLQHVVVRRTRGYVKKNYPNATLRKRVAPGEYEDLPIVFPTRMSGADQCLRYNLSATYQDNLYERVIKVLSELRYPLYGLGGYVRPEHEDDTPVRGIRKAGTSLRGLFKVLLLKRVESSVRAFLETLGRLVQRLEDAEAELRRGIVRVKRNPTYSDEDEDQADLETDTEVPVDLFDQDELARDIASDLTATRNLMDLFQSVTVGRDAKVQKLRAYLTARPPTEHRTLIFTQFTDTAEYLSGALNQEFGRTATVYGSAGNALRMAQRFAPKANKATVPEGEQVDLLITTDVLSEGINLQDADTLINYDLHWNPVRLIQRAGRIDRIGSEHAEIHIASFLPEKALEAGLGLEDVLRRRIREFIQVFGEDSHILPDAARPTEELMVSAYTGAALAGDEEEDQLDGLSKHASRILQLRRVDPDHYAHICRLRPGRRAASTATAPGIVVTRMGWLHRFWKLDDDQMRETDALDGLDQLHEHSKSQPREPETTEAAEHLRRMASAQQQFNPIAATFREQREAPRLVPAARYVYTQLEAYMDTCLETRRPLVAELKRRVLQGQSQYLLARRARQWKSQRWTPEMVFEGCRTLLGREPETWEALGEPALLVGCFGVE